MSAPSSIIHVCSGVLLNNDYLHTIWFGSLSEQLQYFAGKVVKTFSAYTYIRKSWSIKVESTMEQARSWSYLYFQNGNGKTYFYFINNIEYVNDHTVELFIEMDVMQTYLHEYTLHKCFVEREHSATDEVGDNLLEESLDLGELTVMQKMNVDMQELVLMILSTGYPIGDDGVGGKLYGKFNGVFSGLSVYAVESANWGTVGNDLLNNAKFNEAVVCMWMYPKALVSVTGEWGGEGIYEEVTGATVRTDTNYIRPVTIDGYTPKNKKLLTYPYNFLYVSNNGGGGAVYKYERFNNPEQCSLRICGAISPEGGTKLYPIAYNNQTINYDEGIMGPNYPSCAWNQDMYKLWLAQNQNSQNLSMMTSGVQILAGTAVALGTGGLGAMAGIGMMANGASNIAGLLAQRADMDVQPPQAKGNFSSSINIANEHQTFTVMTKCVDAYHAQIIDDYFSLYGYKTNRVKVPNRNVREKWCYTKTVGCHVSGSLCTDDLRKIQSIYDNGITFWKDGDLIGSYTGTNNCV